jgi:hypothetical protein
MALSSTILNMASNKCSSYSAAFYDHFEEEKKTENTYQMIA